MSFCHPVTASYLVRLPYSVGHFADFLAVAAHKHFHLLHLVGLCLSVPDSAHRGGPNAYAG